MIRTLLAALGSSALAISLSACGNSASSTKPPLSVSIQNYQFAPQKLKIAVGQTVVWTNRDPDLHTVASDAGSPVLFNSPSLGKGRTVKFTFNKPGTIHYHCTYHFVMSGTIVVSPAKS